MGRRLNVGLFLRGNIPLANAIVAQHHRTIIMSDRFRPLFHFVDHFDKLPENCLAVENTFQSMPLKPNSLDVLVLSRGLPSRMSSIESLRQLGNLLVEGGLLIWPQPITDGRLGKISRAVVPIRPGIKGPMRRHQLCHLAMKAGFREIGQHITRGTGPFPWAVTTGVTGYHWSTELNDYPSPPHPPLESIGKNNFDSRSVL